MESQYANPDGLIALAEQAAPSEGRAMVWREALKAVGETSTADIVAAAKRVAPERQAKLREELKTRFQSIMIDRFKQASREQFQDDAGAMRFVGQRVSNKEPVTAESFPVVASNGAGKGAIVVARPEAKEMDKTNLPYAVLEMVQGGASLGTWLVSPWLNSQEIEVAGKTWRVAFRPERNYQPFSVKLLKTTFEVYRGTEIPKNFQSRVHIENLSKGETRDADIYMNNPLRYAGLTFFQYQMGQDEHAANIGTSTLQVVRNPSWLTPYLGCILVALGMGYQFLFHLVGFIAKRRTA
ncbi:MAG: cytochrome c biogenesis protein ResB [Verrucomicrobiota bacterium]